MTEADWLTCSSEPLRFLAREGRTSDRKLRLFGVACCRWIWNRFTGTSRDAVEVVERYADRQASDAELDEAHRNAEQALLSVPEKDIPDAAYAAFHATYHERFADHYVVEPDPERIELYEAIERAATYALYARRAGRHPGFEWLFLLGDIFGNPFRPVAVAPEWRSQSIVQLADAAYRDRQLPTGELDTGSLGVLADALEERGCNDEYLLGHLRSAGPHVRGCWAVDLLLGKE
jgi:hypothetical protein